MLIKHRYGNYGLFTYLDLAVALSVGIVMDYNVSFPTTRNVFIPNQEFFFNLTVTLVSVILVVLTLRNIPFGLGQDFYDGTIITFLQMKGRNKVFLYYYFVDVILPALFFIFSSIIVFYLALFNASIVWILNFLVPYLFLCTISYAVTILTKKPFRAFFISIMILFAFLVLDFVELFSINSILIPLDVLLFILSYYLFKGASV